jgi:hypothetical protein
MIYNWYASLQKRYDEGEDYTFDGDRLYENLVWSNGSKPTIEQFESMASEDTAEAMITKVREERNKLIAETDWTQFSDVPESTRNLWQTYRQALRDITEDQSNWSWNDNGDLTVNWPDKP